MPDLCRFYGIIIRMYFDDHNHQEELRACWEKARNLESLDKIDPLR